MIFNQTQLLTAEKEASRSYVQVGELCVVVWEVEKDANWFLGYVNEKLNNNFVVEHLHRYPNKQNDFWKYPTPDDIQTVSEDQIIPCKIDGDWESTKSTVTRMDLKYHLTDSAAIIPSTN